MQRLFKTHDIRKTECAPSLWDFKSADGSYEGKITVPSCWETIPILSAYKGKATYTKKIKIGGNTRLTFKGVSHTADVYLDGKHAGHHYNAYTPFSVDLGNLVYGEHEIKVEVDNSYNPESTLHKENDYYTYGGIIRPLVIETLDKAVVEYIHFTPKLTIGGWCADISVKMLAVDVTDPEFDLILYLNDKAIYKGSVALNNGEYTTINTRIDFPNVLSYTPESPNLYFLKAEVEQNGEKIDDLIERVGFREIKCEGKKILLNGNPIKLKGFNRHEDYNSLGSSIPLQAIMRDIALMQDVGANAVRTCHYPNDELFLDVCDEMGMLVWEEEHARGLEETEMSHPNFIPQSIDCIDEMITNHYNHPSIFCWGMLNECVSHTEFGRSCYETLYNRITENDKSRPRTSASNRYDDDICLDLADIVSMNIYPDWYPGWPDTMEATLEKLKGNIAKTGNGDKPLIISEIGAGAVYGFRSETMCKWSEDYQAKTLDKQLEGILADDDISAVFLWQFADCRVDESIFLVRPRSVNNKGILDEYRRRKLSYDVVKKHFRG